DVQGGKRLEGARVMQLSPDGSRVHGAIRGIPCDVLAVSGGWSPVIHLSAQSGAKAIWDDKLACFRPGTPVQAERSAGACAGSFSLQAALAEGLAAGAEAAKLAGCGDGSAPAMPAVNDPIEEPLRPLWLVPGQQAPGRVPKAFVDLQNDVGASDLRLAVREGFENIEHVKRYTAMGFGTDQGKLGNINGMGIVAQTRGAPVPEVGTTTFRPNYTPVTFGTIAGPDLGDLFEPIRKTATHEWAVAHGAEWENVGQWKRAWYFPKPGEDIHAAVNRECLAARNGVGVMDASTLGKIDIQGPDAATFLNWVYTNNWDNLKVGHCRYGLMLDENGMVIDDGVTARLAENHFYMTTTTGGAARVMAWLERWLQTEWPHLKVHLTSQTDHWATVAVVGPKSRAVVSKICEGIDFDAKAFPLLTFREGKIAGVPGRVMRITFSGELAYELNVPADYGRHVWEAVMEAGREFDITPYGTETMHVLRAEKGYIIVGQDTDGSVTPIDLGMDWIVSKKKDFLGKRSLSRSDTARPDRKQLVGLLTEDPQVVLPEGAQMVSNPKVPLPMPMDGHVTSSYYSANLGRSIAMALIKNGRSRMGETLYAPLADGRVIKATITAPVFIDDKGRDETQPLAEFLRAR
ncbi:MAG TPA: glycine cleavage T C-terminal barrel domain-containing protein, partial [Candidatus Competibacteraceae bacterium]|nr:glycine cleavage T C-terminal barrel domain-containing protein [Candidatus Competibacteraceae bacterium]